MSSSDAELPLSLDSETDESAVKDVDPPQEQQPVVAALSPAEPRNIPTESLILKTKISTKQKVRGLQRTRSRHLSRNINTTCWQGYTPAKYLNRMKANQHLFRKCMSHQLNVVHFDFCHITRDINTNYETAKKMLQVESQRNQILFQMNSNIDRLADSIQRLANQQQTDRALLHGLLQERRLR